MSLLLQSERVLQFRILGPLEVANESGPVELGGPRQRSLLAVLLLRANEIVSTDSLLHAIWGEHPPRTAPAALQNGISQLRKLLGAGAVETRPPGYRLHVLPEQIDVVQFEQLVQRARGQAPEDRAQTLARALALWRGEPLADLTFEDFAQADIHKLAERRLQVRMERLEAELECGRHADAVSELEGLVKTHPLHEGLTNQLIIALYRCGRQAEAMRIYLAARASLDEQYGQPPGPELQETYRMILNHAGALASPAGSPRDDRLGDIARAMLASRLVPVLGPGLSDSAPAPDPAAAAHHLSEHFGCPAQYAGNLARVGQWISVTHGVGPLYDELHVLYAADFTPGPAHRSLAALPALLRARGLPCPVLLTSSFDRMLEHALSEAGEPYDVVSFVALGRDRGKFLYVGADGSARVIDEPNLEVGLASPERTLILKLNGGTDELSGRVRDSYVVSEDDFIDYLSQSDVSALLPIGLAAHIRRSHLLFVGYELDEWSPRVFLRRLWGEERIAYRSWAIAAEPNRFTTEQWRQLGVDVLEAAADESLEELRRRLAEEPFAEPAA
jgi:DNA-binding SARP family transcriptional activator